MKLFTTLLAAVVLTSCAHLTPTEQKLIDCGTSAVAPQVPNFVPQVTQILAGGGVNWQSDLSSLIVAGGEAAICAIEVAVQALQPKTGAAMDPAAQRAAVRGYLYLELHGYQTTGAPMSYAPAPAAKGVRTMVEPPAKVPGGASQ